MENENKVESMINEIDNYLSNLDATYERTRKFSEKMRDKLNHNQIELQDVKDIQSCLRYVKVQSGNFN
jgi:tRNA C32,U32 (ribose-2'-O)-methylase TrmJ